jgi:hypothetical protein
MGVRGLLEGQLYLYLRANYYITLSTVFTGILNPHSSFRMAKFHRHLLLPLLLLVEDWSTVAVPFRVCVEGIRGCWQIKVLNFLIYGGRRQSFLCQSNNKLLAVGGGPISLL